MTRVVPIISDILLSPHAFPMLHEIIIKQSLPKALRQYCREISVGRYDIDIKVARAIIVACAFHHCGFRVRAETGDCFVAVVSLVPHRCVASFV